MGENVCRLGKEINGLEQEKNFQGLLSQLSCVSLLLTTLWNQSEGWLVGWDSRFIYSNCQVQILSGNTVSVCVVHCQQLDTDIVLKHCTLYFLQSGRDIVC